MGVIKVIEPEATTNLVDNPSIEKDTTGYSTGGTNTIARSSDYATKGNYSLKCTYQDNSSLATYGITLTATAYTFSVDIYIPSSYTGTDVEISFANFAGSSPTAVNADMTKTDQWQRLEVTVTPDSGDLVGDLVVRDTSPPTAGDFIYIDAVQCENKSYATTYCDGDQEDCIWNGIVHNSASVRALPTKAGGRVRDLIDDLSVWVENAQGLGMNNISNVRQDRAILPGSYYQRAKEEEAVIRFSGTISGSTLSNLHSLRETFLSIIRPDQYKQQPTIFRWTGGTTEKEIGLYYDTGYEIDRFSGFANQFVLQFIATDPFWQDVNNSVKDISDSTSGTMRYVAGREAGVWTPLGPPAAPTPDPLNPIQFLIQFDEQNNYVYFGGEFGDWDGQSGYSDLVFWDRDTETWNDVITTTNNLGIVYDMAVHPDGTLYVGTDAGLYDWDGATWTQTGSPSSAGVVRAVTIGKDGNVYFGGDYTNYDGDANCDRICMWDGTNFNALSTGLNGSVQAMENAFGNIYVTGGFTDKATRVGYWSIAAQAWVGMGTGLNAQGRALDIAISGNIFVGGDFTTADGVTVDYVAEWNGSTFLPLGTDGPDGTVNAVYSNVTGKVYVGGDFAVSGLTTGDGIAYYVPSTGLWYPLEIDLPGANPNVFAITGDKSNDDIYIAFDLSGTAFYSDETTITNNGTAKAYPIITINRSGGTTARVQSIVNNTTGSQIVFDEEIFDGEEIVIDLRPGRQEVNSTTLGPSWTAERWVFKPGSNIAEWALLPGDNSINLYVQGTGTPTITAIVQWRNTYWGVDD